MKPRMALIVAAKAGDLVGCREALRWDPDPNIRDDVKSFTKIIYKILIYYKMNSPYVQL